MNPHERLIDEILVLRCQTGDVAAMEQLVERWQPRLWRHALRLTGEDHAAWDVLQEAWIGISRGIGHLADSGAFSGWAYRIVTHKCRDWLRRQQRQRRLEELYGASRDTSDHAAELTDHCTTLREALELLSGADRALLALRYDDEFTTVEIAAILDIPEGTVKSRLFHARQRLRKFLEESDERT